MNTQLKHKVFFWTSFILLFIQAQNVAFASHAQSADLTYQCLGGNQYRISLSFYRDCAGVAAPNTVSIDIASASCGQSLTATLSKITGTGIEVSPICASMTTQCSGGSYPGVQEYKYQGVITLPMACTDWIFSFSICCRNASIGTILNPSSESMYVEAHLDNYHFPCNNSPQFSNPPIPFVCVGQPYCFNNGSSDADGDSLYYTLIAPETSSTTTVTYVAPYSAAQPLASTPAVTFNNLTGDMCMTPSMLQVTVFAILVEEWRAGEKVGSVMRDIQLRTINCTNNNPYANGINNTGIYTMTACAGVPVNFNISSYDPDTTQNVTITWNSGIAGATLYPGSGARPVATFSWTPTAADINNPSNCFTITVQDDNCPYNGSQTYSFCITVTGLVVSATTTDANCGASNGTALAQIVSGTGPFTYQWLPSGSSNPSVNGLTAGTYTVNVTNASGCIGSATATVNSGAAPGNLVMDSTNVTCYGANNGTATANHSGGTPPYTYLWSNGSTSPSLSSLAPGTYSVEVTTANGCVTTGSVMITQPAELALTVSHTNVACNGAQTGSSSATAIGGTAPYSYSWSSTPAQYSALATGLGAGSYTVTVTDDQGCTVTGAAIITQPAALTANAMVVSNVSCNGFNDAVTTVGATGGTGAYSYSWNSSPAQPTQTASNLSPGTYTATVTDANNCIATSSVSVTEPAPLTLSTAAFPVSCYGSCNGQTVVIPAGGTASYSYQWLPGGGTSASSSGLCAGTYSITVTDANGCVASAALAVTQPAPLTVSASGSTTICLGQNTTVSAAASGGTASYTYNWAGVGTGANQTVSPSGSTVYSVIASDANGCTSLPATVSINVTSLTAANLSVSAPAAICYGDQTTIFSNVTGNTGPVTISWSGGLGSGNGPFTVSPASTTTYTVTVTDACGTAVNSTVPVTVHPLPAVDLSPQSATACNVVSLGFTDNSTSNAGAQYHWDFGDGTSSSLVTPVHYYYASGIYNVSVLVTSPFGCATTANTTCNVTVYEGSKAEFSAEGLDGSTMSPVYKFHNESVNAVSYYWTFGDATNSIVSDPVHTYASKGIYSVMLFTESEHGCRDSVEHDVEIRPEFTIYIPNAFTPDGNGTNDYFTAKGQEISEFKMMIFDRWGELIFQTDDISKGWDGTANHSGRIAENGVYVYKIEVRDFEQRYHDYTGHVTLLASE